MMFTTDQSTLFGVVGDGGEVLGVAGDGGEELGEEWLRPTTPKAHAARPRR